MNGASAAVSDENAAETRLRELARIRFQRSIDVGTEFFGTHADAVARACLAMARRFRLGGRLREQTG